MNLQFLTNNEQIKLQVASFIREWEHEFSFFESKTSGSTGIPKIIRIEKKYAEASAQATINFLQLNADDNALLCLSTETIGGKMMIVRSLLNKMHLFIEEPTANPLKNIDILFDFIAVAPIQVVAILQESPEKLRKVRCVIVGGGVLSEATEQLLRQEKITVFQTFGMTETISHIALRKVGYEQEDFYTTLTDISVRDVNGNLCIHAPLIGIQELITNDAVEVLNDRQFKWIGRTDFVINSGGVKIQLEELEKQLQQFIPQKLFVHPKKDEKLGEKVVLIVEGAENDLLTSKAFYSFLENRYHIPKEIGFIPNFILTPSHKINRIANFEQLYEHGLKQIL